MLIRRMPSIAAIAVAVVVAASCSHDQGKSDGAGSAAAAGSESASATAPASPNVVTVIAKEYSFEAPAQIPAGLTTIRLVDEGKELHHVQLVKLEDGKTFEDFAQAVKHPGPPPTWAVEDGGPNPPRPGGGIAEVTQVLEPGNYVLACFVPSADGMPHIAKGMMRPITVTPASAASATEPVADIVMTLNDYGFELSKPLTPGKHVIRIENAGQQAHELVLARMAPGKKAADLARWVEKMAGPPPAEPLGGIAGIHPGGHGYITVDLTPGNYGFLCFILDAKDGKPHVAHGMMEDVKV